MVRLPQAAAQTGISAVPVLGHASTSLRSEPPPAGIVDGDPGYLLAAQYPGDLDEIAEGSQDLAASPLDSMGEVSLESVLSLHSCRPFSTLLQDSRTDIRAGVAAAFEQMLAAVKVLNVRVEESEGVVAELQGNADDIDEKRRLLARHADRAERDRDAAVQCCEETEAASRRARADAAPFTERFMECEVLRSQLQVTGDELVRLKEETAACHQELGDGWPRLAQAEDAEVECNAAVSQLEAAHAEEIAILSSNHREGFAALEAEHEFRFSGLEDRMHEELATLKANNAEELMSLRAALEAARWEADMFRREHADIVRETCLRQRENARLLKRQAEAKQEAVESSVKLEAIRVSEVGAPAREAELQALQHRYAMLHRTAAEWGEALQRKRTDCEAWRRWAVHRGAAPAGGDFDEAYDELSAIANESVRFVGKSLLGSLQDSLGGLQHGSFESVVTDEAALSSVALDTSAVGSTLSSTGRSLTATPGRCRSGPPPRKSQGSFVSTSLTQTSAEARGHSRTSLGHHEFQAQSSPQFETTNADAEQGAHAGSNDSPVVSLPPPGHSRLNRAGAGIHRNTISEVSLVGHMAAVFTQDRMASPASLNRKSFLESQQLHTKQGPGEEFVEAVLKAADLEASGVDRAAVSLQEANNEIEMLAFLLDDVEIDRATRLLRTEIGKRGQELVQQRPGRSACAVVVRRLQTHLAELRQHVKAHAVKEGDR